MRKEQLLNIHFSQKDEVIVNKIRKYCEINNLKYNEFAAKVFEQFFKNPDNEYSYLTREELIAIIKLQKGGRK